MNNIRAHIAGLVASDPKTKEIPGGTEVLEFSVPCQPKKDGPTTWVTVKVWGKAAKGLSWLKKGHKVSVHGRLSIFAKVDDKGAAKTFVSIDSDSVEVVYSPPRDDSPKTESKNDGYPSDWDNE